jgi:hypothetical protein
VVAPGTSEVLTLFNRSRALTETDTVVLADFANSTATLYLTALFARAWLSNWNNRRF